MTELAVNHMGEPFAVPAEATHWMVRRMSDVLRGGPQPTFTAEGRPIVIPIESNLAQFHQVLREHRCQPGRYRLDPVRHDPADRSYRPIKGISAYLPFPESRDGGSPEASRGGEPTAHERPRNGNASANSYVVSTAGWSTGGAFPLPVPVQMTGAEYLLGEKIRADVEIERIREHARTAREVAQADAMVRMMDTAAELVRAADGASLPKRKPMAEREAPRPQVIVQQVPVAYDDEPDEDDTGDEPASPPPKAGWTDKLGDVFGEFAPLAKMMLQAKLADAVGGGSSGLDLDAILGGRMPGAANVAPRNAATGADPAPASAATAVEAINHPAEALEYLGCVIEQLSGDRAGQALRDELRRMDADARVAFALDLLPFEIDEACEEAVAKIAAIRVRRSRAMVAAERARGGAAVIREYDGGDLVPVGGTPVEASSSSKAAPAASDEPATYAETAEEPADAIPTPGYEHVRTTTGPTGHRVSLYRPRTEGSSARTPAAPSPNTVSAPMSSAEIAALLQAVQSGREDELRALIAAFPGGVQGIEAALGSLPPELAEQISAARGAASATGLSATAVPTVPAASPAAMARLMEILPHLAAAERATAQAIALTLPAEKRALLLNKLVAVRLPEAVAIVKEILAIHAAHGNPVRS